MEPIPLELLFGDPARITPQISPDAKRLAYLASDGGPLNLWAKTIGADDDRRLTDNRDRGITHFYWAGDSRHILFLEDRDGTQSFRLHAVSVGDAGSRELTPFERVGVQIVAVSSRRPEEILIAMNRREPYVHDVYRLKLTSGEMEMVVRNPGLYAGWIADTDLTVRAALSPQPDGSFDLMVRETESAPWRALVHWSPDDILSSGAVGFSADGRRIYLIDARGATTSRLISLDVETEAVDIIAGDPEVDLGRVVLDPVSRSVQAVSFTRARTEWRVLDEGVQDDYRRLAALAEGDFTVISRDAADSVWVVGYDSDIRPVSFYLYRRSKSDQRPGPNGQFLFCHQPRLLDYRLSPVRPISLTARDGLPLRGYLTLPHDEGGGKAPLVIKVHGGPWVRDSWGLDPEVQWLADRGFACLQINFRGSTGYGKGFVNAATGEWGRKMIDDLVDGALWAARQEGVDPQRVAIYGVSYGGYAALVAAARFPDLFRCAIDVAGPTDLVAFMREVPRAWNPYKEIFYKQVGDPGEDRPRQEEDSPIHMAARLRIPVMIVHGVNDTRVNKAHSDRMAAALQRHNVPHEYLEYQDEGHSIGDAGNRLRFYTDAERFLQRHLAV
jgi:dipeptidyl aminopeptidase/acylaminoacyl peptidase